MATVQRVLARLWSDRRQGWLTNAAYDGFGRAGALTRDALRQVNAELTETPTSTGVAQPTGEVIEGARGTLEPSKAISPALEALLLRIGAAGGMSWSREVTQPVFGGRAHAWVQALAIAGLVQVARIDDDIVISLNPPPQHGLAPSSAPQPAAAVTAVAAAYRDWANGAAQAGARIDTMDLQMKTLRPLLSEGERHFVVRQQVLRERTRRHRLIGFGAVSAVVLVGALWQSYRNERATYDLRAQAEAAERAAIAAKALAGAAERAAEVSKLSAQQNNRAVVAASTSVATAQGVRVVVKLSNVPSGINDKAVEQLLQALRAENFIVDVPIAQMGRTSEPVCGDVRFSFAADQARAQQAVDVLNKALRERDDPRQLRLAFLGASTSTSGLKPGEIEVSLPPLSLAAAKSEDGQWLLVEGGCATLGSDDSGRSSLMKLLAASALPFYEDELRLARRYVPAFYIGRTEVTMAQFAAYRTEICARDAANCPAWRPRYVDPQRQPNRPAVFISWAQAAAYCRWAGGRLPTDVEWEKAARGPEGRFWPWGEQPDDSRFQGKSSSTRAPVDVGSFPSGASSYGALDMAGNVWEYTADFWHSDSPNGGHTIRGGSYLNDLMESRASVRWASAAEDVGTEHLGFRCARDVVP